MKLKPDFHSSTSLERLFGCLAYHREASTRVRHNLRQRNALIEHHKPAHPWIALGAFGGFPLDPDHREFQLPVLLEMQVGRAADLHARSVGMRLAAHFISGSMGLGTL